MWCKLAIALIALTATSNVLVVNSQSYGGSGSKIKLCSNDKVFLTIKDKQGHCICTEDGVECSKVIKPGCYCPEDEYFDRKSGDCLPKAQCNSHIKCKSPLEFKLEGSEKISVCGSEGIKYIRVPTDGCYCPSGHYKDSRGKCVPNSDCEETTVCYFENEEYTNCGSLCPDTCEESDRLCAQVCVKGCFCKKGYVRDNKTGNCIRKSECEPKPQICYLPNEEYNECGSACPDTCQETGRICTTQCVPGCFCKRGYVRDTKTGRCVRQSECEEKEVCTLENEKYTKCGSLCPDTCEHQGQTCAEVCVEGCFCKPGFVRDTKSGNCIRLRDCVSEPICTGPHEERRSYGKECNCDDDCIKIREEGCYCKNGYVRNKHGICVQQSSCPPKEVCGDNQVFDKCAKPEPCRERCGVNTNDINCAEICVQACVCKPGYILNKQGTSCVPKSACVSCGRNETVVECENPCQPTCEDPNKQPCPTFQCTPGCHCKDGYIRDRENDGECIRIQDCENCPQECSENEHIGCQNDCEATCENPKEGLCFGPKCRLACVCKNGFVRNKNGKCIPLDKCKNKPPGPPKCNGKNEILEDCVEAACEKRCVCIPGYERQYPGGPCVKCEPKCDKPNTEVGCKNSCPATCDSPNRKPCLDKDECFLECQCKEGYVLNKKGDCVRPSQCPSKPTPKPPQTCGRNEVLEDCKEAACKKRCVCIPGYEREYPEGPCVPCKPKCQKPNMEVGCKNECPRTCDSPNKQPCIDDKKCVFECQCKVGYVLNKKGDCVRPSQCPSKPTPRPPQTCGRNEVLEDCKEAACKKRCVCIPGFEREYPGGPCVPCKPKCQKPNMEVGCKNTCPRTCDSPNQQPCVDNKKCVFECQCKSGYVLNKRGDCVRPSQCPSKPTPKPPQTCGRNEVLEDCKEAACNKRCVCIPGFEREYPGGPCVPCKPKCQKPNMEVGCKNTCPRTCNSPNQQPCVDNKKCVFECQCKSGYVLNKRGDCVRPSQCPNKPDPNPDPEEPHKCGPNQVLEDCVEAACKKRCVCIPGYEREYPGGPCVPCKPKCEKPNTEVSCKNNCPATCDAPNRPPCLESKCTFVCQCKPGFVLNKNGDCVRVSQCQKKPYECGVNENWQNAGKDCNTCENPDEDCDIVFVPGCYCKPGFVRGDDGECTPKSQCPGRRCLDQNERYLKKGRCGTCREPNKKCEAPGCYCKRGLVRNSEGKCVSLEDCDDDEVPTRPTKPTTTQRPTSPITPTTENPGNCRPNEIWSDLGRDCATCENPNEKCPWINRPACYCRPGFVRAVIGGPCVPKSFCKDNGDDDDDDDDDKKCGANEVLANHGKDCATCDNPGRKCPVIEKRGCYCKDGYVRDWLRNCVLRELCTAMTSTTSERPTKPTITPRPTQRPETCGRNEVYQKQGYDCETCDNYKYVRCSLIRIPGCYCKEGYVRDQSGACVSKDSCHNIRCGPNEIFARSGRDCATCKNPSANCPVINKPDCYCREGYVRNELGDCISLERCPDTSNPICKSGEILAKQGFNCSTCENYQYVRCQLIEEVGCYCRDGYVRNSAGRCVPTSECEDDRNEQCEENEIFKTSGYDCATCRNYNTAKCPLILRPSCFCKDGYVRNRDGKCVRISTCHNDVPKRCGPHEVFQKTGYDCATCENYRDTKCQLNERPGCFCREGFVRDRHDKCIPIEQCEVCGRNEVFKDKGSNCTCANWKKEGACKEENRPGCYCKEDYVRNAKGECIHKYLCGKDDENEVRCEENEQFQEWGLDCDVCDGRGDRSCIVRQKSGCYCKPEFVRNRYGRCVRKDMCLSDPNKRCGRNEVFKQQGRDCYTCENYAAITCPLKKQPDCYCEDGYVRNHKGQCVLTSECDSYSHKRCARNEIYKNAGFDCATCDNYQNAKCKLVVKPDCYCANGHVRDKKGRCVDIDDCPSKSWYDGKDSIHEDKKKCNGRNEIFRLAGFNCATCQNYKHAKCSLIIKPDCYCKDGHVRNAKGECTPIDQCEKIHECSRNEVYEERGSDCKNCEDPTGKSCKHIREKPGCYCKQGYLRDEDGECVHPNRCSPKCGYNEVFKHCGCEENCNNFERNKCRENDCKSGCFCKEGYVRDEESGNCVKPRSCPDDHDFSKCDRNEEFVRCKNECEATCSEPHRKPCKKDNKCKPGCECKRGYLRHRGECVPEDKCIRNTTPYPKPSKHCGKNEVWKDWGADCASCDNYKYVKCHPIHKPDCYCAEGHVRDKHGDCVPISKCEDYRCKSRDPNSEYHHCAGCNTLCPGKLSLFSKCSPDCNEPGCRCKKGFFLNKEGFCGNLAQCLFPTKV